MEEHQFHEGPAPPGYSQDFESSLFNAPRHLSIQAEYHWYSFHVLHKKYPIILASVHFHILDAVAHSPLKSPFGSVEFSADLSLITMFRFLEFVASRLKERGVKKIVIKDCPFDYQPSKAPILHTFLFNQGYRVIDAEVGALIPVTSARFEAGLDDWERRKLRQSAEAELTFKELDLEHLGEAYLFILACRKFKGYTLSMTLPELKETVRAFRENFRIFGVYKKDSLVATSISILVQEKILYNFYSSHSSEFDSLSPIVFLISHMYSWCQDKKIEILDLGTSALDGKPNFGLLEFKLRLGAKPTPKLTFEKNLA